MRRGFGLGVCLLALALVVPLAGAARSAARHATAPKPPQLLAVTPTGVLTLPSSVLVGGSPSTVAADSNGTVYVGLGQPGPGLNSDIAEFDSKGNFVRTFGANLPGGNPLLAVGPDHNVYAWAFSSFSPIREYSPAGALIRTIPLPASIVSLSDLELDSSGNIFATGYDNNGSSWKVFRFDSSGNETSSFALGPGGDELTSLAVDPDGTLWVVRQSSDTSILFHVTATGVDLKDAPYLGTLDGGSLVKDIDFADGRLYAIGFGVPFTGPPDVQGKVVLTTFSPSGWLISKVVGAELANYCCHDQQYSIAVVGKDIWATGIDATSLPRATASLAAGTRIGISHLQGDPSEDPRAGSYATINCASSAATAYAGGAAEVDVTSQAEKNGCELAFFNEGDPCPSQDRNAEPVGLFQNGEQIGSKVKDVVSGDAPTDFTEFVVGGNFGSGPVFAQWICVTPGNANVVTWEYKGDIELYDPSGVVLDSRTGRGIPGASVSLQVSPGGNAPFGTPSIGDIRPQTLSESTAADGSFGWDVAPGHWRVKVTAFGYKPYLSAPYDVPPPVTGLRLMLRADPAQQRYLIDPKGRVGALTLGGKARRVSGLRARIARGHVRGITVLSARFRTELGIHLRSSQASLDHAYPQAATKAIREKTKTPKYRVGRATFTVRGGRVVAIVIS